MHSTLSTRLARLEEKFPKPERERGRFIRIVASKEDEEAAYSLALEQGFDPSDDSDDVLILRLIVAPPGKPPYSKPPEILSISGRS
jgi:hypothetical protein